MSQRAIDGEYIYFVTTNVKDRRWYFITPEPVEKLGRAIQTSCQMKNFDLLAYCILPNHVHVLVRKRTLESVRSGGESERESAFLFPDRRLSGRRAHRTLESVRCEDNNAEDRYLFPHRRLSSRRHDNQPRFTLSQLMQSIKGSFSRTLPPGSFWQHRSYFRIIDSDEYFSNVVDYIRFNYTKMDLPDSYGKPPFVFIDDGKVSASA